MATDGVKIIDGDSAFDIYVMFMDAYDQGADTNELLEMYSLDKEQYSFDDAQYEICVTVYALAFWEIGELTPTILDEVRGVIEKGAGVTDWTEQVDEKAGKARQKELDKFLAKISKPTTKIRKRKKCAKVKNLIFNIGDVLSFQLPDGTYGLTVLTDIMQYRGECDYMLCRTTLKSKVKPGMGDLSDLRICGSLVPTISSSPKLKMPWVIVIQHKNLRSNDYRDRFEKIGNVTLRSNAGSSTYAGNFNSFCESFYLSELETNTPFMNEPERGEFTIEELQQQPYR